MDNQKEELEKALLSLIDIYNLEDEKDRAYFRKYKKNNPDSGLRKEPFISFYQTFQGRVPSHEITDFLYHFGEIRLLKTFHFNHHAESLIESFEKLNLPVPHFVLECQKEVIHREDFIKNYFEKEKFKWSKSKRDEFFDIIKKEAVIHSIDLKSERKYLKKKFEETIQETKEIEKNIESRFGYYVKDFFDGETFTISKDELNEYFYHSEIASGGFGSFFNVFKELDLYVSKKNEVFALRDFLRGINKLKSIRLNEFENKFNSMPIEEVREHFRPLTEKKNRISGGEIWMAKEDFEIFLRRSFGGETNLPKPKINIGSKGKYAVVKLFHSFYEKTLDHPYNGPREKDPVFNLLKDAFKTSIFDNERKDNFKSDKSKYPWS